MLPGLYLYVEAFNRLSSSRQVFQGGLGSIPYSEISGFCRDERIFGEDREDLIFLVQELDKFFVEWHSQKIKREMDSKKPASNPKRGKK